MKGTMKRILSLLLCLCLLASFACAEESGEAAPVRDAETEEILQDFTLKHGSRSVKKVAITVDYCYKTATDWIEADVALCKQYNIHMTFFPLYKTGCLLPEFRDVWQSVLDAGCEIGCHGYQHLHFGSFDYWTLVKRMGMWQEKLDETLGYHYATRWVRAPGGSIDGGRKISKKEVISALKRYGYEHLIHWDVSETIDMEKALSKIQNGSIMLFHTKKKDTRFLEKLIPILQEQGYEMVTLSELFGFDPPEISEELYVYDRKNYED